MKTLLRVPFAEKDQAKSYGARWDPAEKTWYWPGTEDSLPDSLLPWYPKRTEEPEQRLVLDLPFDMRGLAKEFQVRWNPEWKTSIWEGRESELPPILRSFRPKQFSWEAYTESQLNPKNPVRLQPGRTITLRDHQGIGVDEIGRSLLAGYPGFLLADEAGLGKTITGWEAACRNFRSQSTIIIVCPLSVQAAWRQTILDLGHPGFNTIILNYERLNRLFQETDTGVKKKTLKGLAKRGEAFESDLIIWDECQRLRNLETARTKFALRLYETRAKHFWLSATAGENPLELGYLLPLLIKRSGVKPIGRTALQNFEDLCRQVGFRVSRGAFGKWQWDGEHSADDCEKMQRLLFAPKGGVIGAIRRRPEEIAGWPALQRIPQPTELNSEQQEQYNLEWNEFKRALAGMDPKTRKTKTGGLAAITRFRQKASLLRVDSTVDLTKDLLEEHHQVAISCQWHDTINKIKETLEKEHIRVVTFTGEENPTRREDNRKLFQTGGADVILFTVEEGINLQEGEILNDDKRRAQIDHDIRWSAVQMYQIDHRCHRDGKFAKVYWTYGTGTKEEDVGIRMLQKLESMAQMSGDETESIEELIGIFEA